MKKISRSLALRLLSSLVLIPAFIGVAWIGNGLFIGVIGFFIGVALIEWMNIARHFEKSYIAKIILVLAGILYLGFSFFEMIFLRQSQDGFYWVVVFMASIWASDSVAYAFGKNFGGPKMTPTISPNKTWSGYAGALMGPAIILVIAALYFPPDSSTTHTPNLALTILFGLMIGICGQSGDLLISWMKRRSGLKDTGALIPGHGGVLDRIDALLMAFPVFISYVAFASSTP